MPRGTEILDFSVSPFQLGELLVDPNLGRLTRGATTVHVELRVMDVLVYLAIHTSELVTRKQLIDSVWGTEFISDNTLTHAIAELRSALEDDAKNPTYIETLHRRGYRLLARVGDPKSKESGNAAERSLVSVVDGDRRIRLGKGENIIGRLPWATVTIQSLQVSRRHAQIVVDDERTILEDLGSKNGTRLNGRPVYRPSTLSDGDKISLGSHVVAIHFSADTNTAEAGTPTRPPLEA